jgi:hypothetical protein
MPASRPRSSMDRAPDFGSDGCEFESRRGRLDMGIILKRCKYWGFDAIVRWGRFDGRQATSAGEREVRKALRKTLFKYKLHSDQDLFDKAYGYIKEYY